MACLKRLKASNMPLSAIKEFANMRHTCGGEGCNRLKILKDQQKRLNEEQKALLKRLDKINTEINMFKRWNNLP